MTIELEKTPGLKPGMIWGRLFAGVETPFCHLSDKDPVAGDRVLPPQTGPLPVGLVTARRPPVLIHS